MSDPGKTLDVLYCGKTYRIALDHAHVINKRGHLIARRSGYPVKVTYEVESDRCIEVIGEPLNSQEHA